MYYLHYDMDAFFASIEIRDNPKYRNYPLAVGGGVISSCNYIARKRGLRSAMPIAIAKKICPELIVINGRVSYYFSIGRQIQEYIASFFEKCDFVSCDEGFIDITEYFENNADTDKIQIFCERFKKKIQDKFNLTLSVGVGENKTMAKIASEINKPNGIYIFRNKDAFIDYTIDRNVGIFPGIGKKSIEILNSMGIKTTRQLMHKTKSEIESLFGENRGDFIYNMIRGNSSFMSKTDREKDNISISKEHTFYPNLKYEQEIFDKLEIISEEIEDEIKKKLEFPKTLILKIRYEDFSTHTKSKTFEQPIDEKTDIFELAKELYFNSYQNKEIRLMGLTITNFKKQKSEYIKLF